MADIREALSRMSPQERDIVIRTLLAEAGNQGPQGLQAVAAVIGNRSAQSGMSPGDVVTARNQFEPWNTASGRAKMAGYSPQSMAYARAGLALDQAAGGNDPTGGATHFYSPKAQAAMGRAAPSWAQGQGTDIGDHRFYNLGYQPGNRHGIPPRPPGDIPQVQMDPAVRGAIPKAPSMSPNDLSPIPPAPNTLAGGGTNDSGPFDPIKKIAKTLGLSNSETESFRLGLALGGSDPFDGWGKGLQGGFSSGGFGAEGVG